MVFTNSKVKKKRLKWTTREIGKLKQSKYEYCIQ